MDRTQKLLAGLSRSARLIEIGPSFSPLAAKSAGWNVFTIDHADRAGLVAKYEHHSSVDTSRIEEVDFVWTGGPLSDAVPVEQHGTFDAFIASHVIEHTTDIVEFLRSAQTLLQPNGLVILAAPDKRKCFDSFRPVSTTGAAVAANVEGKKRHGLSTFIDHFLYQARKTDAPGWHIADTQPQRLHSGVEVITQAVSWAARSDYTDAHQWVFTPSSLHLMIVELAAAGLLDLRVERVEEAEFTEFFVWLRKGAESASPEVLAEQRLRLMNQVVIELAEQARQVPGSPLALAEARIAELEHALRTRGIRRVVRERLRQAFGI